MHGDRRLRTATERHRARAGGLQGALLFGLHPLQVESVAWISETRGLLAGLLSVLAILVYLQHRGWSYAWATGLMGLALLAKSSAAATPLIALILDVGVLKRPWRGAVVSLLPWFAMAAVFATVMKSQQMDNRIEFVAPLGLGLRSPAMP